MAERAVQSDVIVVGAGWAGLMAAALATARGAKVRLIAQGIGSPIVTPGWVSVIDSAPGDVGAAVRDLIKRAPDHPYALAGYDALEEGVRFFQSLTQQIGLPYSGDLRANRRAPLPLGGWATPALTPPGYSAEAGESLLYAGFAGWRDYYPALSGPHTAMLALPGGERPWDLTPVMLAREFDNPEFRAEVAAQLRVHRNGASAVALPAVIGLDEPERALAELSAEVGAPVVEMPTLPPSAPGTRLFQRIRRYLLDHGARVQIGHAVARGLVEGQRAVGVEVAAAGKTQTFRAGAVILATGNLYGGGLFSDDRGNVWEPIFGLPVQHDPDRSRWFARTLLAPGGHPVHHFGVRADSQLRALDERGQPVAERLFVAGHLLAQSGGEGVPDALDTAEGIALATAYRAVVSALGG
jgi:glycerol-3-phosphate dehydrogenase subunit B